MSRNGKVNMSTREQLGHGFLCYEYHFYCDVLYRTHIILQNFVP